MVKKLFTVLIGAFFSISYLIAQTGIVEGTVKDAVTLEPLIGANIVLGPTKGTITDLNGKFSISVPYGDYDIITSYVGYETEKSSVAVNSKRVSLDFALKSMTIDEVIIVADVARSRETPVAFTNVPTAQIAETLAGQDIPMILNTTPGVYATQLGGGDGDARITIRGFDQRNIAVMIDGIPVNDMENGWVYWSNWFGLDAVTRTIQIQRGLGASKLALPSVGGTMNILTSGIESKRKTSIKQSIDSQGKILTNFGFTSGPLNNGWGVTVAGAYKRGNGWVENTFSEGWFYYAKVDKRLEKHIITLSAMGAPQTHDQRSYTRSIPTYSLDYAKKLGIDVNATDSEGNLLYVPPVNNMGVNYNQHWGYLKRDRYNPDAKQETLSERTNIYHKPQFSLRDFWTVNEKLTISNILYLSIGKGGGDSPARSLNASNLIADREDPHYGRINWQAIYDANSKPTATAFGLKYPIKTKYSDDLYFSDNYLLRAHNEHYWYGLLSTASYKLNDYFDLSGGVDLRSYKGVHYRTVTDLLGGDYVVDKEDERNNYDLNPQLAMHYEGDTIAYYYEGLVNWGGVFTQLEYKYNRLSSFINISTAVNGYKKVDYFVMSESDWKWKPGFTIKTGANYNVSKRSNFFFNLGYLSKVRAFNYYYIGYTTDFREEIENERIKAFELGYHYGSPLYSININTYLTRWENKPTSRVVSEYVLQPDDPGYTGDAEPVDVYADIPGMDAFHMGVEIDLIYKPSNKLDIQGLASFGDWKWDKIIEGLQFYTYDGNDPINKVINFDARGIHVGDAAQTQLGTSVRYEPIKGMYLNGRYTYFAKYFSNFSPESTTDENDNVVDSWKMPAFGLVDFHAGYRFHLDNNRRYYGNLRFSLLNLADNIYITDARNNDGYSDIKYNDFDAKSATVFFGQGRRFVLSFEIQF
jgi:iron complex outermembrane receptor protein